MNACRLPKLPEFNTLQLLAGIIAATLSCPRNVSFLVPWPGSLPFSLACPQSPPVWYAKGGE